eukprot:TRINITY_DN17354_c0_g1_i1.p1 TRINITY_DN17354_c0_g1~~TRINITY_DN17354_c0_g1_i1.p1  ORF type:complete len:268 (-),score=44.53 TRINITY_DN17354_c0_g1_i1:100-903(-)
MADGGRDRSHWKKNEEVDKCQHKACEKAFGLVVRRHHCRHCGGIFCQEHSEHKVPLNATRTDFDFAESKPTSRVCNTCYDLYVKKAAKLSLKVNATAASDAEGSDVFDTPNRTMDEAIDSLLHLKTNGFVFPTLPEGSRLPPVTTVDGKMYMLPNIVSTVQSMIHFYGNVHAQLLQCDPVVILNRNATYITEHYKLLAKSLEDIKVVLQSGGSVSPEVVAFLSELFVITEATLKAFDRATFIINHPDKLKYRPDSPLAASRASFRQP